MPDFAATSNCLALLTEPEIADHSGWEASLGATSSFYVRGATWFRNNVLMETTKLQEYIPQWKDLKEQSRDWLVAGFDWNAAFSPKKAFEALSARKRKPVRFDKAVLTILLCEATLCARAQAGETKASPGEALSRMKIEPAVYYIRNFDFEKLEKIKSLRPNVLDEMAEYCAQHSKSVFSDMIFSPDSNNLQKTTTKRLADRAREFLTTNFEDLGIGSVDFAHHAGLKGASIKETLHE